jgi:hypothetical protein
MKESGCLKIYMNFFILLQEWKTPNLYINFYLQHFTNWKPKLKKYISKKILGKYFTENLNNISCPLFPFFW